MLLCPGAWHTEDNQRLLQTWNIICHIHPPSVEIKNWTWFALKDEILPSIESMLEIGVRCWVKWIYRGTVTESIPRISTNTKLTANNIQQKKVESLLLIEFFPGFSVFVIISPINMINPVLNLVLWEKGEYVLEFLIVYIEELQSRRRFRMNTQPPVPGYLWNIWKILISWRNIRTMSQKWKLKLQVC